MIEIIKEGKKRFVVVCPNCDAIYSYELSDIAGRSTRCLVVETFVRTIITLKRKARARNEQIY